MARRAQRNKKQTLTKELLIEKLTILNPCPDAMYRLARTRIRSPKRLWEKWVRTGSLKRDAIWLIDALCALELLDNKELTRDKSHVCSCLFCITTSAFLKRYPYHEVATALLKVK